MVLPRNAQGTVGAAGGSSPQPCAHHSQSGTIPLSRLSHQHIFGKLSGKLLNFLGYCRQLQKKDPTHLRHLTETSNATI